VEQSVTRGAGLIKAPYVIAFVVALRAQYNGRRYAVYPANAPQRGYFVDPLIADNCAPLFRIIRE
jgi:hypothetical protein